MEQPEMLINPKAEEMCAFEEKNYLKCKECPRTLEDQNFCALNTIKWRLGQMDKVLQSINAGIQTLIAQNRER